MCRIPPTLRSGLRWLLLLAAGLAGAAAAQAAGSSAMTVSAVVLSKSNCKFSGGAMILDFGTLNPASSANATASASIGFSCNGSAPMATFAISAGNGLHSSGPGARRMRHATVATEFIAYSISLSPTSATVPKGVAQTLTVAGTIAPGAFQNATVGTYSDTVVITLTP